MRTALRSYSRPRLLSPIVLAVLFCAASAIVSPSQVFTTLHSFTGYPTEGSGTYSGLVQGNDGNFYGTTGSAGANGGGTVFRITPAGTLTTLYSFCAQSGCTDGNFPYAGLVQGTDGNFYGTTVLGGLNNAACNGGSGGCGTVFKITPGGTWTLLYSFCSQSNCTDGFNPYGGLAQGVDGNFYGTTSGGGNRSQHCYFGCGTVFKITPGGALTPLHSFVGTDGAGPVAGLVQATDGNFYGTAGGGPNNDGTVFKITPGGALTTLHVFDLTDGAEPEARLVQAPDGSFFGTTTGGGAKGSGTVFKISPGGTLATIYSFCSQSNCTDGIGLYSSVVQANDGNLFGTAVSGGLVEDNCSIDGCGTIFELTPGGTLTILHSFQFTDGASPYGGLVQGGELLWDNLRRRE